MATIFLNVIDSDIGQFDRPKSQYQIIRSKESVNQWLGINGSEYEDQMAIGRRKRILIPVR